MSWKRTIDLVDAMEIPFLLRSLSDLCELKVRREKMAMRDLEALRDLHRAWEGGSGIGVPVEERVGVGMGVFDDRRERLGPADTEGEIGERGSLLIRADRLRGGRSASVVVGEESPGTGLKC